MIFMGNTEIWIPKRLVETGLLNLAAAAPETLAAYCEQEYAARIADAVAQIEAGDAHVVMLTGPSASGKTTTGVNTPMVMGAEQ